MSDLEKKSSKTKAIETNESESVQKKARTVSEILARREDDMKNFHLVNIPSVNENKQVTKIPSEYKSWACLQFYENKNLVMSNELYSDEPIKITAKNISKSNEKNSNFINNYSDWDHVLGDGFIIKRQKSQLNRIEFQRIDTSVNEYKIFSGDKEIHVKTNDLYEITNPEDSFNNINNIRDLKSAHELKKFCHIFIGINGDFMKAMGPIIDFEKIHRGNVTSLPYWILLKLNTEFNYLDEKVKSFLK